MKELLNRAMALLAQRDHSTAELRRKLAQKPSFLSKTSTLFKTSAYSKKTHQSYQYSSFRKKKSVSNDEPSEQEIDQAEAETQRQQQNIEAVINHCNQQGWLNDQQYTERYCLSRSRKGYGKQRIRQELLQRGIDEEAILQALDKCDIDWSLLAKEQAEKKFGSPLPTQWPDKGKVLRHLIYRGFLQEDISVIFDQK